VRAQRLQPRLRRLQQPLVTRGARRSDRGENAAAGARDLGIVDAEQALFPLLGPIAAVNQVRVRIDQPRRDEPAAQVDRPIGGGRVRARAREHDRFTVDRDRCVIDQPVRLRAHHRREAYVRE
jgi:hypothetical protein